MPLPTRARIPAVGEQTDAQRFPGQSSTQTWSWSDVGTERRRLPVPAAAGWFTDWAPPLQQTCCAVDAKSGHPRRLDSGVPCPEAPPPDVPTQREARSRRPRPVRRHDSARLVRRARRRGASRRLRRHLAERAQSRAGARRRPLGRRHARHARRPRRRSRRDRGAERVAAGHPRRAQRAERGRGLRRRERSRSALDLRRRGTRRAAADRRGRRDLRRAVRSRRRRRLAAALRVLARLGARPRRPRRRSSLPPTVRTAA